MFLLSCENVMLSEYLVLKMFFRSTRNENLQSLHSLILMFLRNVPVQNTDEDILNEFERF